MGAYLEASTRQDKPMNPGATPGHCLSPGTLANEKHVDEFCGVGAEHRVSSFGLELELELPYLDNRPIGQRVEFGYRGEHVDCATCALSFWFACSPASGQIHGC